MKRIFKGILALTLIAALLMGAALAASGKVTTTGSDLKMRSGPGTKYIIVNAIAKKNTTVSYSDYTSSNGGWYYVSYDGDYGWISASYAKEKGSGDDSGRIRMTGDANVRTVPDKEDGDIRTTAHKGEEYSYTDVEYDDRGVAWYYIKIKGYVGWVSSKYAEEIGSSDYVHMVGNGYMREEPDPDGEKTGTVIHKGETAEYLDTETDYRGTDWYYVNYKGEKGWISSKYAKF